MKLFGQKRVDLLSQLERPGDGRNVDPELGTLSGEGSAQEVKNLAQAHPVPELLTTIPSRSGTADADSPSYYGAPVVKEPVWVWSIPVYFFVGGLSGATSLLGTACETLGGPGLERLARRCRWVGTLGDAASSALLIYDLGRPSRFLNMLRVFRPTSPMSMGAWILACSGSANGLSVLLINQKGWLKQVGDKASTLAGTLGGLLSGYTAVLTTNTAVPTWQGMRLTLPFLFTASSVATSASLLSLLPHGPAEARVLRAYGLAGRVAELFAAHAVEREISRHEELARPLHTGAAGVLWKAAKVLSVAGLALSLLPGGTKRTRRAGDVLTLAGALATRWAVFQSGRQSARDPQATFKPQRAGLGAAEVTGHARASDGKPFKVPLPVVAGQRAPQWSSYPVEELTPPSPS